LVSLLRYVLSLLHLSLTGVIVVALLRTRVDRTTLTLTGGLIALLVGFVWSRFVYSQQSGVEGSCFTSCGRDHDQAAVGSELQYRLTILGTKQGELLGCVPQLRRKPQWGEAIGASGGFRCRRDGGE